MLRWSPGRGGGLLSVSAQREGRAASQAGARPARRGHPCSYLEWLPWLDAFLGANPADDVF